MRESTYQCLHGTVKSVSVVATELGVDTLEGRVTVGLGLLDTVGKSISGCEESSRWLTKGDEPVTVSLLALVVLGRVLRLCTKKRSVREKFSGRKRKGYELAILTVLSR